MKPDTQALLDGAASEHGIPDVDAWIDSAVAAIHQQERELEMLTEALRIASTAVESLHLECDRHRQAANEHRNAAMEADQRTMAAVRGEKRALGDVDLLRAALVAAEKAIQEAAADMVGYCGKDPEQLAEPLRRAADARIAVRAALTPNVELRG